MSDTTRNTVRLAPGAYTASITVANKRVNVFATGSTISSSAGVVFTVLDAGVLTLDGGTVVSSSTAAAVLAKSTNNVDVPELIVRDASIQGIGRGIQLWKAKATILRSTIRTTGTESSLAAIVGSSATVDRTTISGGGYVVASADESVLRVTNSVIGPPTAGDDVFAAIGGSVIVSFSTVLGIATCTSNAAVCSGPGANGVCFDNSIVANLRTGAPANAITGQACTATYTLAFPQSSAVAGVGNKNNVNPKFKNSSASDYHLDTGSPAIDAANPAATLGVDFDGKMRPQGAQRDHGAFEYP